MAPLPAACAATDRLVSRTEPDTGPPPQYGAQQSAHAEADDKADAALSAEQENRDARHDAECQPEQPEDALSADGFLALGVLEEDHFPSVNSDTRGASHSHRIPSSTPTTATATAQTAASRSSRRTSGPPSPP